MSNIDSSENVSECDTSASQYTHLPNCINDFLFGDYIEDWYMTQQERFALITLLNKIKPECAIEVGTLFGGSLSVISKFSKNVYSLDIDSSCRDKLADQFPNVEFIVGKSQETLPLLIRDLQDRGVPLEFALIDASHTKEGVKQDIESLLEYKPVKPLYIAIHDSFMPECRAGMVEANWSKNPYVHVVELDFIPGRFNCDESNPDYHKKMVCGLAIALLLPYERTGDVKFLTHEDLPYKILKRNSIHKLSLSSVFKSSRQRIRKFKTKMKKKIGAVTNKSH